MDFEDLKYESTLRKAQSSPTRAPERGASAASSVTPVQREILNLQRSAGNAAVAQLLSDGEERDDASPVRDLVGRGGGSPMPSGLRSTMESSLGHDFSSVRVHSGAQAESAAKSVSAKAFTVGDEIVLGRAAPSMGSAEGQRTLAHELTHVVQQRSGPVEGTPAGGGVQISDPSDRFEMEAERVASGFAAGSQTPQMQSGGAGSPAAAVQRELDLNLQRDQEAELAAGVPVQREEDEDEEEMQA